VKPAGVDNSVTADAAESPVRRTRRQKVFAVLPTLLTLCNAACGFGAITITAKVGPEHFGGSELITASQLIFLAMLFDMLDGSAARLTNQTSDFGAQLDSLCDAISFGVAPAFIFLQLAHPAHHLMDTIAAAPFYFHPRILWAIAVLFMMCAILRLARFNVETDEEDSHEFFSGLPSPAAGGVVASLPIGMSELKSQLSTGGSLQSLATFERYIWSALVVIVPLVTLSAAVLMVSRLKYAHVFNQLVRGRRGRLQILQIVFSLVLVFIVRELALPVLFGYFAFSGPVRSVWQRMRRQPAAAREQL
jgi:CDP-diacylglycerol--serine O-phosphatidyltransferase